MFQPWRQPQQGAVRSAVSALHQLRRPARLDPCCPSWQRERPVETLLARSSQPMAWSEGRTVVQATEWPVLVPAQLSRSRRRPSSHGYGRAPSINSASLYSTSKAARSRPRCGGAGACGEPAYRLSSSRHRHSRSGSGQAVRCAGARAL